MILLENWRGATLYQQLVEYLPILLWGWSCFIIIIVLLVFVVVIAVVIIIIIIVVVVVIAVVVVVVVGVGGGSSSSSSSSSSINISIIVNPTIIVPLQLRTGKLFNSNVLCRHRWMRTGNRQVSRGCYMPQHHWFIHVHLQQWLPWQRHFVYWWWRVCDRDIRLWWYDTDLSERTGHLQMSLQGGIQERRRHMRRWDIITN